MIVADASVLADAMYDRTARGERARDALAGQEIHVPDLVFAEVGSVLRRRLRREAQPVVDLSVHALISTPWTVHAVAPLIARAMDFRANTSTYDAIYVALAERLGCSLITMDAKMAHRLVGATCDVTVHA